MIVITSWLIVIVIVVRMDVMVVVVDVAVVVVVFRRDGVEVEREEYIVDFDAM